MPAAATSRTLQPVMLSPPPQVLTWAVVEEHSAGAQRLVAALEGEVPQRLADTAGRLEELQREHAALQEAVDSKVGVWHWCAGGQAGGHRQQAGAAACIQAVGPSLPVPSLPPHPRRHLPPPAPPLQGTFLNSYKDRANALSAEFEGAKVQAREAHRAVRSAVAKMKQLQQRLEEEQERKEVRGLGAGGVGGCCRCLCCCCCCWLRWLR